MGARLRKMIIPEWEHRVILSPAWSASQKQNISTSLPHGSSALGGLRSVSYL
jgi:hypothetical protein